DHRPPAPALHLARPLMSDLVARQHRHGVDAGRARAACEALRAQAPPQDGGGVALGGDVDEARHEPSTVTPYQTPHPLPPPPAALPPPSGLLGPPPAPVRPIATASSAKSACDSSSRAASIQPSTCAGERAPTMAPVTSGQASVQATATDAVLVPRRAAMGFMASARARLRLRFSPPNSLLRVRQSSSGKAAARSVVKRPLKRPDCIGLYTMIPVSCAAHHGSSAAAAWRRMAEKGGCSVSTWPTASASVSWSTLW